MVTTTTASSTSSDNSSSTAFSSTTGNFTNLGCESLGGRGLILSTTNTTRGTVVYLDCDDFGHRPSGGVRKLDCLDTWVPAIPTCEWSWDLTTQEKIIFGTAIAAAVFIIIILIAVLIAYFCCYKKRKDEDEKIYDSSYHESSSPKTDYDGHYQGRESYPITYLAYQDVNDGKYDNSAHTGTLDKPWLGYIPRPRVTERKFHN